MKTMNIRKEVESRGYVEEDSSQQYIFKRFVKKHVDELTDREVELVMCVNDNGKFILLAEFNQFSIRSDLISLDEPHFERDVERPLLAMLNTLEVHRDGKN